MNLRTSARTLFFSGLLATFLLPLQALATGESVSIDSFDTLSCTPQTSADGVVTHENGTEAEGIRFTLKNLGRTTEDTFSAAILPSGTYSFGLAVPDATEIGDQMQVTIDLLDDADGVIVSDSLEYLCGIIPPVPPIPTLSHWGIALLALLFLGLARRRMRSGLVA